MADERITLPTGESVDPGDVDSLLSIYQQCKRMAGLCAGSKQMIAKLLGDRTPDSDSLTRRSEGTKFRAVIQMPSQGYDQPQLKRLWDTTEPKVRERVLRIETIGIQKREFKKLEKSDVPAPLKLLMNQIIAAGTGSAGNPTIKSVERIEASESTQAIQPRQAKSEASETG